jgi:hypothetical protein
VGGGAHLLLDSFGAGAWKIEVRKGVATLTISQFVKFTREQRDEVEREATALSALLEPEAVPKVEFA